MPARCHGSQHVGRAATRRGCSSMDGHCRSARQVPKYHSAAEQNLPQADPQKLLSMPRIWGYGYPLLELVQWPQHRGLDESFPLRSGQPSAPTCASSARVP